MITQKNIEAVTGSGGLLIRLPDGKEKTITAGDVTIIKK